MRISSFRVLGLATLAALVMIAPAAHASPIFPAAIEKHLKIPNNVTQPDCTVCHQDDAGGTGTVVKAFGIRMRSLGLVPEDITSLNNALDRDEYEPPPGDVDCDGVPDIEELVKGTDPNLGPDEKSDCAGGGGNSTLIPQYGCGAHVAPQTNGTAGSVAALAVVAGLALSLIRRRR